MQLQFTAGVFTRAAVGPAAELRLRADGIHAAGRRLAGYANGFWEVGGSFFTRGHCTSPVYVQAEAGAATSVLDGPLASVRVVDGAVWHGDTLLYRMQPDGRWQRPGQPGSWEAVVLRDEPPG